MPGRMEFEVNFSTATQGKQRRSETTPMRILLMGDFSGQNQPAPGFVLHKLDLDTLEPLLEKLAPRVELCIGKEQTEVVSIDFTSLDSFLPDDLFDRLPIFQHLKTLRSNLNNPDTFAQAAAQLAIPTVQTTAEPAGATAAEKSSPKGDTDLLEQLIADRSAHIATEPTAVTSGKSVDISAFIKNAVAPYIEAGPNPQLDRYIAGVDHTISEIMRTILHDPQFQALEAVWRSAYECITRLELDESISLHIVDVSKAQLQQELHAVADDITASSLYQSVVEQSVQTLGGEPWSVLVGLYEFSYQSRDIECLNALGQLAYHSSAAFIAAADSDLLGCDSLATDTDARQWRSLTREAQQAWDEVRVQIHANWLALTFPRFLLRLPYGVKGEEIDSFTFEELPPDDMAVEQRHGCYLWGNAAIVCAVLIGQSFQQNGWSMSLGDVLELDDLPWHVSESHGEKTIKPCAEAVLSERSAEVIESYGVMPLMSYKDRNSVKLWRFRSLSKQNGALAGPWAD